MSAKTSQALAKMCMLTWDVPPSLITLRHMIIFFFPLLYWISPEVSALVLATPWQESCELVKKLSREKQD